MSHRVFVTGQGIISSIGNNVNETLESLFSGRTGLGFTSFIETIYRNEIPVAEVKLSNEEMIGMIEKSRVGKKLTRSSLFSILAVNEAIKDAGISNINDVRTGLISSTSVGGMDRSELFFMDYLKNPSKGRLREISGHDCGDHTETIAKYFGINGYVTTISTACSSSANAIMLGARLIKNNILDRVIVGGADSLTRFTINGFNTLAILDYRHCRPFDDTRTGLNIGEGAAFLVMESERSIKNENKPVLCEVKGYGNACDAYHQTASSPEGTGPALAMKYALETAGISANEISYVNVHGTGTPNNDLSEGIAMMSVFENNVPPFSSTKPFTGHTLGAAGAIEAVISILSIKNKVIFPNLNFSTPMKELQIKPVITLTQNIELKNVLSNSFGFGGNNTSLIFSKAENGNIH